MSRPRGPAPPWQRAHDALHRRTAHLPPTVRGLLWTSAAGFIFSMLNALMRLLTQQIDPFQAQFLRYAFGLLVILPLVWRGGVANFMPKNMRDQFSRGLAHTSGCACGSRRCRTMPLADMTAIGFTGPIFIMIGARIVLREPMHWERWVAAGAGLCRRADRGGAQAVGSGGYYHLVMLASAPVFAASFLLTKALTRYESRRRHPRVAVDHGVRSSPAAGAVDWVWPTRLAVGGLSGCAACWAVRATTA
jgi:drug/metabolite transporter (DMT)-like permease